MTTSYMSMAILRAKKSMTVSFTVEPTDSYPIGDDSFPAFAVRYDPFVVGSTEKKMPGFDGILIDTKASGLRITVAYARFGYARKHGSWVQYAMRHGGLLETFPRILCHLQLS